MVSVQTNCSEFCKTFCGQRQNGETPADNLLDALWTKSTATIGQRYRLNAKLIIAAFWKAQTNSIHDWLWMLPSLRLPAPPLCATGAMFSADVRIDSAVDHSFSPSLFPSSERSCNFYDCCGKTASYNWVGLLWADPHLLWGPLCSGRAMYPPLLNFYVASLVSQTILDRLSQSRANKPGIRVPCVGTWADDMCGTWRESWRPTNRQAPGKPNDKKEDDSDERRRQPVKARVLFKARNFEQTEATAHDKRSLRQKTQDSFFDTLHLRETLISRRWRPCEIISMQAASSWNK